MFTLIPLIGLCIIEEILTNDEKALLEISGKQGVNMIEKVATYNLAIITTYCHLPMEFIQTSNLM